MPNPVTGSQQISIDPSGKLVSCTAYTQSGALQTVKIVDSSNQVVFEASGQTPSGSGGPFTLLKSGTFLSSGNGTYTVTLTSGAGILMSEDTIVCKGTPHVHQYSFVTNDLGTSGGDADFNDLYLAITVFNKRG